MNAENLADALSGVPALNADIVFIRSAMESLIKVRSPAAGDREALGQIADDAVYLSNRIFARLTEQISAMEQ